MKAAFVFLCAGIAATTLAADGQPGLTVKTSADYLALHASGQAPPETTALQYRLAEAGPVEEGAKWLAAPAAPGPEGAFAFDLPLASSRWSELQLRAMKGGEVLATRETRRKVTGFQLLTAERVAALPATQREAWSAYLRRSVERREKEYDLLAAECRKLGLAHSMPAPAHSAGLEIGSHPPERWFAGEEARKLAMTAMSYQTPTGGWSKAVDPAADPRQPGMHWTSQPGNPWHYCGTIDNRSTTEQIKLLAGVASVTGNAEARAAALRGLEYLLEAQFPNGGWPQNYPLEPGYHEAITLNDNAMVHVLEVLLAVADAKPPFAFASENEMLRRRAREAWDRGIRCLLGAQVKVDGRLTVWCAQHDPLSLEPVAARKKEPASLSGGESAELLRFLMRQGPVTPEIIAAVESALRWLDAHRIAGIRKTETRGGGTTYVEDASSKEVYWARFYDVSTAKPMFAGSQDGIVHATFAEMAAKNRVGYDYYITRPGDLIAKEWPRWRKRIEKKK